MKLRVLPFWTFKRTIVAVTPDGATNGSKSAMLSFGFHCNDGVFWKGPWCAVAIQWRPDPNGGAGLSAGLSWGIAQGVNPMRPVARMDPGAGIDARAAALRRARDEFEAQRAGTIETGKLRGMETRY